MPDVDWILYDTAPFTIAIAGQMQLFQVPQGGDATHTEAFCNTPGAGAFPSAQAFTINGIAVYPDQDCTIGDLRLVFKQSYVEIVVADKIMLKCPMALLAAPMEFSQAVNAADALLLAGGAYSAPPFELNIPIVIPGGTPFKVNITQIIAVVAAVQVKCALRGKLTRP